MESVERHPIKVVSRRTGLSSHLIRIWEKRYQAVMPERTPTNRRLYSDQDIDRLRLLKRVIGTGRSIGQIANLGNEQLEQMVQEDTRSTGGKLELAATRLNAGTSPTQTYIDAALGAAAELDVQEFESILRRAAVKLSQPVLIQELIVPLLERLGDQWRDGTLRIAHEHLASVIIRKFLEHIRTAYVPDPNAPGIVIATPLGQLHEFGALMVAATAAADGWNVTYLGASLPAEDIAMVAQQKNARAVALSIVYPSDDPRIVDELTLVRRNLPENCALVVGGRSSREYADVVERIGAMLSGDINYLRQQLEGLRAAAIH